MRIQPPWAAVRETRMLPLCSPVPRPYLANNLVACQKFYLLLDGAPDVEELPVLKQEEVELGGQLLENVAGRRGPVGDL